MSPNDAREAILVGVDGSPSADAALLWAAEEAHLAACPLRLVNARSIADSRWMAGYGVDVLGAAESEGRSIVGAARDRARAAHPDLQIEEDVSVEDPRVALVQQSEGAQMLVVGSRGRGPLRSLVLGSVSLGVSQLAHCPVVVVRPDDHQARRGVLVGVDETKRSEELLQFAFQHAALRAQPLTVLHCFFDGLPAGYAASDDPRLEGDRAGLDEAVDQFRRKYPDVEVTLTLARGFPDDTVLQATREVAMAVLGRHAPTHSLAGHLLPHVERVVLEHAHCAVAVVPPAADRAS